MHRLLLACIASILSTGCAPAVYPHVVPPAPVVPPRPQPPLDGLAKWEAVKVGATEVDALAALPAPSVPAVRVGPRSLYAWDTGVPRPTGGTVWWEIHTEEGVVVRSAPW